jgi:hypothetical protein
MDLILFLDHDTKYPEYLLCPILLITSFKGMWYMSSILDAINMHAIPIK